MRSLKPRKSSSTFENHICEQNFNQKNSNEISDFSSLCLRKEKKNMYDNKKSQLLQLPKYIAFLKQKLW